jgi:hypothetical protein
MNFSAGNASRKWPCGGLACGERPIVTAGVAVLLLMLCASGAPLRRGLSIGGPRIEAPGVTCSGRVGRGCGGALLPASVPLPKPRPADAPAIAPDEPAAAKQSPPQTDRPAATEQATPAPAPSACRLALTDAVAVAPSIPDIHGPGGCGGEDLVRLEAVVLPDKRRVAVKPAATLRCAMAAEVADWIRTDVAPLAQGLGTAPVLHDNFDSYECRGFNRVPGAHLSEHGRANALDVRALKFANGQSISLTDRTVPRELRESVLHSVCARFTTVLGPGSDGYHEDHIHLDLMERHNNYKICQWNVWDPLPRIAPLLPAERPAEAPPREAAKKE